jgi:hypothetical protein
MSLALVKPVIFENEWPIKALLIRLQLKHFDQNSLTQSHQFSVQVSDQHYIAFSVKIT